MKKSSALVVGLILLLLAITGVGVLWWSVKSNPLSIEPSPSPTETATVTETPVLASSPEATVLLEEEEAKSDLEQIKEAFAEKYNKSLNEVEATINENTGTYAKGLVRFAGEVGGGWWLAFKETDGWIIVADGNGTVICGDIEDYDFSVEMVSECWDQANNKLIKR
jgi:hypothetical protein